MSMLLTLAVPLCKLRKDVLSPRQMQSCIGVLDLVRNAGEIPMFIHPLGRMHLSWAQSESSHGDFVQARSSGSSGCRVGCWLWLKNPTMQLFSRGNVEMTYFVLTALS